VYWSYHGLPILYSSSRSGILQGTTNLRFKKKGTTNLAFSFKYNQRFLTQPMKLGKEHVKYCITSHVSHGGNYKAMKL